MRSYSNGLAQYQIWTKDTASANQSDGAGNANDVYRKICAMKDWPFLEQLRTLSTTASTQFTTLPYDCDLVRSVYVIPTGSSFRYTPKEAPSREYWDQLNLSSFTSDIPEWYFVFAGQIGLWPTPASTSNTIGIIQKSRVIDLSVADLTSSTVTSIANGATTVTLSGGLTTLMAGMYIRITYTGGAATTGDGVWYQIASVTSSTVLELTRKYGGTTIAAATAACTIGQMPLLPEAFHDTPWKGASAMYWEKEMDPRGASFRASYDEDILNLVRSYSSPTTGMVLDDGEDVDILNPNLTIRI